MNDKCLPIVVLIDSQSGFALGALDASAHECTVPNPQDRTAFGAGTSTGHESTQEGLKVIRNNLNQVDRPKKGKI